MSEVRTLSLLRAGPGAALEGHVAMPGDKSISHRALILGAMAEGETRIEGLLESADVVSTAEAVSALGAEVGRVGPGHWTVTGARWRSPAEPVDCGNSGTAARLLLGAAAGHPIRVTFTGDDSLRGRPMARVLDPLRRMGARAEADDRLPVTITGGALRGISHLNRAASAQVKSAILFAGLNASGPVEVIEPVPSRDHSERMLRAFGCDVATFDREDGRHVVLGPRRKPIGTDIMVPGDPSSAAFPLVAALVTPESEVTVHGMLANPLRCGLYETLIEMGADLSFANRREVGGEEVADVTARHSVLTAVEIDAVRAPSMIDEFPILAVAAAFASGQMVMHGLGELRIKESDRLAAIVGGLRKCGVSAGILGDSLLVDGCDGPPAGGERIATHGDHRIAMAFLMLGLASRLPVSVDSPEMIATSFPGFAGLMRSLGARLAGPDV